MWNVLYAYFYTYSKRNSILWYKKYIQTRYSYVVGGFIHLNWDSHSLEGFSRWNSQHLNGKCVEVVMLLNRWRWLLNASAFAKVFSGLFSPICEYSFPWIAGASLHNTLFPPPYDISPPIIRPEIDVHPQQRFCLIDVCYSKAKYSAILGYTQWNVAFQCVTILTVFHLFTYQHKLTIWIVSERIGNITTREW